MCDILRDGTAGSTFPQVLLGVKMRPAKAKPPSQRDVKYLPKVLESLTGPADFESNTWFPKVVPGNYPDQESRSSSYLYLLRHYSATV